MKKILLIGLALLTVVFAVLPFFVAWYAWDTNNRLAAIERSFGGRSALECDPGTTVKRVTPSVVRIIGGFGEGSGFAIAKHYIVTNHHVIDGEPSPKIVYSDGRFENGVVVAADPDRDLAVIHVERDLEPLTWDTWRNAQIGQTLLLFGYPFGGSLNGQVTVNRATIAAFRGTQSTVSQYVQTNGGLIEGMSGGPMVNQCGQVVAVNAAGGESLGLGIDAYTSRTFVSTSIADNPTTPWQTETPIDPDASPLAAVQAYYGYISARNYEAAYAMLSPHFIGVVTYADWANGFTTQLQTAVFSSTIDPHNRWRVLVDIESTDLIDGEIAYREFAGSWIVSLENGHLRLWESNIKEISVGGQ